VFEVPPPVPEPIQKETAESLLRKLLDRNDPRDQAVTYILAVMLERKRILRVQDQTRKDGTRFFIYEHGRSGDVFTVADPNLRLDQLEEVQRDVARLLERGPNPPVEAAPTAQSPASDPGRSSPVVHPGDAAPCPPTQPVPG
jgi:hypothetical protein